METGQSLIIYYITIACYIGSAVSYIDLLLSKRRLSYIAGFYSIAGGLFFHTIFLAYRWSISGHAPFVGLFESLSFFAWSTMLFYLIIELIYKERTVGAFVIPLGLIIALLSFLPSKGISPPIPVLNTFWFEIHVAASFFSYALFAIAFSTGISALIKKYSILTAQMPSKKAMDNITYNAIFWGFVLFSAGMISGGIWAFYAWGTYMLWTPKELWSLIIWIYYAGLLHAFLVKEWQGNRAVYLNLAGFLIVLFTYVGVGLLMKSSHQF
jgi:cytochrome c-type biogenesis protein CcsB